MRAIVAFIVGSLFGAGLLVSGMTDTTKVQGWLDIFGQWDPTLAFVMGGAIVPMVVAWRLAARHEPLLGGIVPDTAGSSINRSLVIGSVLFGMGWALSGLCPGPALASVSFGGGGGLVFLAAMATGMYAAPKARSYLDGGAQAA